MSSRERLLTAIDNREPDRVPICFRDVAPLARLWKDPFERALVLREMGVDDKLFLHPPRRTFAEVDGRDERSLYVLYGTDVWPFHPDVAVRDGEDDTVDERYTVVSRELGTPAGTLRMAAKRTDDWLVRKLPLVSDHFWSRAVEFPVKGREDLERLKYILHDPFDGDLTGFRAEAKRVKDFAGKHDILVEGDVNAFSNIALNLRGATNLMFDAVDDPAFVEEFLDLVLDWNLKRLELVLDAGVDTIYHTACYETTAFWSPAMYRRFFKSRVMKKLELVHQAGAKLHYYMDLGVMPLIDDFVDMGIDILSTLDPAPHGNTDIAGVKRAAGGRICLWGGVNAPQVIEQGSPADVENAVREAIAAAAPGGGFVLSTADSIWDGNCGGNVKAFIEAGKNYGRYPVDV